MELMFSNPTLYLSSSIVSMTVLKQKIFYFFVIWILTLVSLVFSEIPITEAEQVTLESTNTLLPEKSIVRKIRAELPVIRNAFKNVSKIIHQAQWAPGEVLAVKITDEQIHRLRTSNYGPIFIRKFEWGGAQLFFSYPYNPIYLGKELEAKYGIQCNPNIYLNLMRRITFNPYRNEYRFEQGWGDCAFGWPCLYSHYWTFRQDPDGRIRQKGEGGDPEEPPFDAGAASDQPHDTEPYPYAPNKKQISRQPLLV